MVHPELPVGHLECIRKLGDLTNLLSTSANPPQPPEDLNLTALFHTLSRFRSPHTPLLDLNRHCGRRCIPRWKDEPEQWRRRRVAWAWNAMRVYYETHSWRGYESPTRKWWSLFYAIPGIFVLIKMEAAAHCCPYTNTSSWSDSNVTNIRLHLAIRQMADYRASQNLDPLSENAPPFVDTQSDPKNRAMLTNRSSLLTNLASRPQSEFIV